MTSEEELAIDTCTRLVGPYVGMRVVRTRAGMYVEAGARGVIVSVTGGSFAVRWAAVSGSVADQLYSSDIFGYGVGPETLATP